MVMKRRALGRGLGSLLPEARTPPVATDETNRGGVTELDLDRIHPGKHQPRSRFDDVKVEELAQSIRRSGVIQPVLVTRDGDRFQLVAGERRWRAAQRAGLLRIPAVVREIPEAERLQVSLVENLQREDLNPIEAARAYRSLIRELGLTQAEVSERVGKTRVAISNELRLLELPGEVQERVESGELPMVHARALLGLESAADMIRIAQDAVRHDLSAREVERRVRNLRSRVPATRQSEERDPNVAAAEENLARALRARVLIRQARGRRGRVEIHYENPEELQRIYDALMAASRQ